VTAFFFGVQDHETSMPVSFHPLFSVFSVRVGSSVVLLFPFVFNHFIHKEKLAW
jgi:hypothetical protein